MGAVYKVEVAWVHEAASVSWAELDRRIRNLRNGSWSKTGVAHHAACIHTTDQAGIQQHVYFDFVEEVQSESRKRCRVGAERGSGERGREGGKSVNPQLTTVISNYELRSIVYVANRRYWGPWGGTIEGPER